jgi:signal transduction histidine kinase
VQAELRESSARLITAQEDERSRIARELHDDVCQRLALLALEAEMIAPRAGERGEEESEAARRLAQQTRTISSDVHRIAHELHPAVLDQLGLVPALRHFAEDLARSQGLRVDVAARDWPGDVPRDVELALYRVAQEALQNVAKHSGAGEARVALEAAPGEISIRVSDTGCGFETSSARGSRLGFASMTERLRQVGGRLVVESLPGKGTTVTGLIDRKAMSS